MKKGTPYEQLVALAISAFHPGAKVTQGSWIEGPDGRRDLDVIVEGNTTGKESSKLLIECKDYDARKTGPVGIEYIDALDSKRRDLDIQYTIICSNSEFTQPALNKARRIGIGAVSVVRRGDDRIKLCITEKVYYQVVEFSNLTTFYYFHKQNEIDISPFNSDQVLYHGQHIYKWVASRMSIIIAYNHGLEDEHSQLFRFKQPLKVKSGRRSWHLNAIAGRQIFKRQWFSETVQLDAENAFKDWLTGQLVLSPGRNSLHILDTNITGDRRKRHLEEDPPEPAKHGLVFNQGNGVIAMALIEGVPFKHDDEIPPITKHVCDDDLKVEV